MRRSEKQKEKRGDSGTALVRGDRPMAKESDR